MDILEQLADRHLGNIAAVGRDFDLTKQAAHKWYRNGWIPREHWGRVQELLPEVTEEDCISQFSKRKKQKLKRN